ncbi:MAG TPA: ABC transporter ATP-binding protein [Jatrophihabitans sp.]|nr:ABC transporter ATP-binding protein [Jatrophihabitans sp.]
MQPPSALRVLRPACRGRYGLLAGSAGLGLLTVLLDLARPWPLAFAVDHAFSAHPVAGLSPTVILVLAGTALLAITGTLALLDMTAIVWAERAAERIGADLRNTVFTHAISLSPRWHDRMRSGELISRLTTDVGRLLDALVAVTITLLPDALRLTLVLTVLYVLDPGLTAVAVAVVPVLMAFAVRQRRRVRSVQQDARAEAGRLASTVTDLVRNVRAVQAFGRMPRAAASFGTRNAAVRDVNCRAVTVEARWSPVADLLLAVGSGLVLVIGGHAVLTGRLSTGQLLVVISYVSSLYAPIRALSRLSGMLAKSTASADRIDEVLASCDRITDRPGALRVPPAIDEIRFDAVSFAYRAGTPVLADLDLSLHAGETVALVGPSGCGKSTILSLLLRLYDVDAGAITVNGIDVRDLRTTELRRRIAYLPQDAWLLDATIAENIAYGMPSATRHELLTAGRVALVDDIAARWPHGYDTVVGESGGCLSGGQRRRIALARAVVSDASVVLLDEPTASLDPGSAAMVIAAIRRATAGRSVLLVTHDPHLAATADRVVSIGAADPSGQSVPVTDRAGEGVTS